MIRIIFLIRSLHVGGAERQLVNLIEGLDRNRFDMTVITYYHGGHFKKALDKAGIRCISLGKKGRWDVLTFLWRLINQIHKLQPDVLHGFLDTSNLLVVFLKVFFSNTRIVWGVRASNMDLDCYDWLSRFVFILECFLSRFTDLIVVNSYAGRDYCLENRFPENKIVVIPNGIDSESFCPDSEARKRIRGEWGIAENERLIGYVARLDPMKDHPTFLKAAAHLVKEREDVHFVCVGDGKKCYRECLIGLGEKLGLSNRLTWVGERKDAPAVYNSLDIASLSSSFGEGFPNVVGEAMACGVPCVVTGVGDSAWIVGDTGVVVPPRNPRALAEGWTVMLGRIGDPLLQVNRRARERIVSYFGVDKLVEKNAEMLEHIV